MFTPKELQEKTFDKAVFGGYDMQMVDEFLEPLTEDYITLYKENSVLKSKMKILVEKLEEYRAQELSMKKALVAAQQTSEGIIADAQKKAAAILNDAEQAAQHKEESLRSEFAAEQQRVERARATAQAFIAAVENDVQQHVGMLERLKRLSTTSVTDTTPAAAPVIPQPKAENKQSEDSLAAEIGNAVQEIVSGKQDGDKSFRFEDLQFGKDYAFPGNNK